MTALSGRPPASENLLSKRDLLTIIFSRKQTIFSVFIGVVSMAAFLVFYFITPRYEVEAMIVLGESSLTRPVTDAPPTSDSERQNNFNTQRDVIESTYLVTIAVDELNLAETRVRGNFEKLRLEWANFKARLGGIIGVQNWKQLHSPRSTSITQVQKWLTTTANPDSKALKITYLARDPDEAYKTLSIIVREYISYYNNLIREQAKGVENYLAVRFEEAGQELFDSEQALLEFRNKDIVPTISDVPNNLSLKGQAAGNDPSEKRGLVGITDSATVQEQLKLYILAMEEELRKNQNEPDNTTRVRVERDLRERLDHYLAVVNRIPERELKLLQLERQHRLAKEKFLLINRTLTQAGIVAAGQTQAMNLIQIIESPQVPDGPVFPKRIMTMVLAICLGLGLGVALAFVMDFLDHTVRTARDVESHCRLRLIGSLGRFTVGFLRTRAADSRFQALIKAAPRSRRRLLSKLLSQASAFDLYAATDNEIFLHTGDKKTSVLITSAEENEGRSSIAIILAAYQAAHGVGKRVLLVDADLYSRGLTALLGAKPQASLEQCFSGQATLEECIYFTGMENLHLATLSLDPRGAIKLSQKHFGKFLDTARRHYDFIIVDSSANGRYSELPALARLAGAALMVIRHSGPTREQVQMAVVALERSEAHILGAVMNCREFPVPRFLYR